MGLEIKTNKTPGEDTRVTPAPRPPVVGVMIVLLTLIQLVLLGLVFYGIGFNCENPDGQVGACANSPSELQEDVAHAPLAGLVKSDQQVISLWLGALFVNLGFITLLYQRYFMDHVTIAKRRFRKWEDEGVQMHD